MAFRYELLLGLPLTELGGFWAMDIVGIDITHFGERQPVNC